MLDIAISTVFRWRHKILAALRDRTDMSTVLGGIVEARLDHVPTVYLRDRISKTPETKREAFPDRCANVNAYHSRLKSWIVRFYGVATKYLGNDMTWFEYVDTTVAPVRRRVGAAVPCDVMPCIREPAAKHQLARQPCAVCGRLITDLHKAGRMFFVPQETVERTSNQAFYKDCFENSSLHQQPR